MKLIGMTTVTRMEYKINSRVFKKYMGNQQIAGIHFDVRGLYAQVLRAAEVSASISKNILNYTAYPFIS